MIQIHDAKADLALSISLIHHVFTHSKYWLHYVCGLVFTWPICDCSIENPIRARMGFLQCPAYHKEPCYSVQCLLVVVSIKWYFRTNCFRWGGYSQSLGIKYQNWILFIFSAQGLCRSWGGRPGLPNPNSPTGLCGPKSKRWILTCSSAKHSVPRRRSVGINYGYCSYSTVARRRLVGSFLR